MVDNKNVKISPSILSLPLKDVSQKIEKIETLIDYIHIDVMDGKFVENKTKGVKMFKTAKRVSSKPLDVHLMAQNPVKEIKKYKGAEIITFHIEATNSEEEVEKLIKKIKQMNVKVGISVKPNTSVSRLTKYINDIDLILIMTVEPGYGGQQLIEKTLEKITELRQNGYQGLIEVDGGVTIGNSAKIREINNGVDIIVAGTAIFSAEDEIYATKAIKGIE